MKKMRFPAVLTFILIVLVNIGILLYFYSGIENVYFQQDEWHKIGKAIYYARVDFLDMFRQKFGFHFIPLATTYYTISYLLFGINAGQYLIAGIVLQAVAGYLVYGVTRRLFGSAPVSLVLMYLFLINPGIHQVMLNEMVSLYTLSFILVLSAFIALYDGIKRSVLSTKRLVIVAVFTVAAFMMLEVWIALFVLLPAFAFVLKPSKKLITASAVRIYVLALVLVVGIFAYGRIMASPSPVPNSAPMKLSFVYNAVTVPVKFIVEYSVGLRNIYAISAFYQKNISYYRSDPSINQDLMAITASYEIILYYLFALLCAAAAVILAVSKSDADNKKVRAVLVFGLLWIALLGVTISPQGRYFLALESRYLYLGALGVLLSLGSLARILGLVSSKNSLTRQVFIICAGIYILVWSRYSYMNINTEKEQVLQISSVRRRIVSQILDIQPNLPKKTIIYMYCTDGCASNTEYGQLPEWVVPFQNGFGWTLLVMYADKNPGYYAPFFEDLYFWERMATGYRAYGDIGFGYVTEFDDLTEYMKTYGIPEEDVLIFAYDSGLRNITKVQYDAYMHPKIPGI